MFLDNQEKNQCCGCMACSKICSSGAITMVADECGFSYPHVNMDKCKDCGLCEKICPMRKNYVGEDAEPDIYALRSRNKKVLEKSSSGGMFTLLAKWALDQNGVVYGVAFDDSFQVRHQRAVSMDAAKKFRGSKYVESDLSQVYENILSDLKEERVVLLTGTPCQISGVTAFLQQKRAPLEKLYTCDNICHGVPSRKVWADYLDILKKNYIAPDDEITFITMRSKKVPWTEKQLEVGLRDGDISKVIKGFSFNTVFSSLYAARPSCFNCRYTSFKRPSDFTLGDFWNGESAGLPFDTADGVSLVLVNTEKGRRVFAPMKEAALSKQLSRKEGWQPHLEYSAKQPSRQSAFWEEYNSSADREAVLRKYMKGSAVTKMVRILSPVLRKTGLYNLAGKAYKFILVKRK